MRLETIIEMYGMQDYYEMSSGRTFHLSQAKDNGDGTLEVPVSEDGRLIGYTTVRK